MDLEHNAKTSLPVHSEGLVSVPKTPKEPDANRGFFQKAFNEHMRSPVKHDQVHVLLLSWDSDIDDLNAQREVESLRSIFIEKYGFDVRWETIEKRNPAPRLNFYLADFLHAHDEENTLLIIYYAGDGNCKSNGIQWQKSTRHYKVDTRRNHIAWLGVQNNIISTVSDVLVIFDCCAPRGRSRLKFPSARFQFDFIAACSPTEHTRSPGKESFTSALMWSLEELRYDSPFTTITLFEKIKTYEHLPKSQTPVLLLRGEDVNDSVWITSLKKQDEELRDSGHEYIDLRFNFYRRVETEDATNLAKHLSRLVNTNASFPENHISLADISSAKSERRDSRHEHIDLRFNLSRTVQPEDSVDIVQKLNELMKNEESLAQYAITSALPGDEDQTLQTVGSKNQRGNSGDTMIPESIFASEREETSFAGTTLADTRESLATTIEEASVLDPIKSTEDYISIASNGEDIASQAARRRTEPEILAVKLFSSFFAESKDLHGLHENALSKLGPSRFLENYRRILKSYVLELQKEAKTALEKDTVKVIESRVNRKAIAQQIVALMTPEYEDNARPLDDLAQQPLIKQSLEDWAKNAYGMPDATLDTAVEQATFPDEGSDEEEGGDKQSLKYLTFANIEQAYQFLQKGSPFQTLVLQLRLLGLNASLREIVDSSPKSSIKISSKNDMSILNRTKGIVEDYTASQWDWWPLAPKVPDVAPDRLRLEWQFCGQPLYREITSEEAESMKHILSVADEHPSNCHCCKVSSSRLGWRTVFWLLSEASKSRVAKLINHSATGVSPPSRAHLRYTPTPTATTTGTSTTSSVLQNTSSTSPTSSASGSVVPQAQSSSNGSNVQSSSFWVVFGIKDMRGFNAIENIPTQDQSSDTTFFQDLRRRHARHRWLLHRLFSPYRFRHCKFVQFERIIIDEVSCCGEALPDDQGYATDYEYHPRPPAAKKPLIDPSRFSVLLTTCNALCYWSLLPKFLHKCRRLPADSREWLRIPRKKSAFDKSSVIHSPKYHTLEKIAFGIEADYLPCMAFFLLYHAIPILSGFGFWVYWLIQHPGDLQNASVPLFTVLALMTLSWAFLGKGMGAS